MKLLQVTTHPLPHNEEYIIAALKDGTITVGYIPSKLKTLFIDSLHFEDDFGEQPVHYNTDEITFWMPLPQSTKVDYENILQEAKDLSNTIGLVGDKKEYFILGYMSSHGMPYWFIDEDACKKVECISPDTLLNLHDAQTLSDTSISP